jgi:hypothetical protein
MLINSGFRGYFICPVFHPFFTFFYFIPFERLLTLQDSEFRLLPSAVLGFFAYPRKKV